MLIPFVSLIWVSSGIHNMFWCDILIQNKIRKGLCKGSGKGNMYLVKMDSKIEIILPVKLFSPCNNRIFPIGLSGAKTPPDIQILGF